MSRWALACILLSVAVPASMAEAPRNAARARAALQPYLPAQTVDGLVASGEIHRSQYREKNAALSLTPNTESARRAVSFWVGEPPPFFVESLYLFEKPANRAGAPGAEASRVSVILRSVSRLEGIEYFSTSRQRMRTLYARSYAIDGEKTKRRVPDPVSGNGHGVSALVLQEDLTFGENVYRYDFLETSTAAGFLSRNVTPMRYSILKAVDAENLRVSLIVEDLGEYLLVYGLTRATFSPVPGVESKLNASFTTRAQAIYAWFIREYNAFSGDKKEGT